jgi:type IV pilus assembly protein PilV
MQPVARRGFTLLEVLIALLVFSLGLLGLAGLMVVSVKTNQSAYLRTQASFLAQSMADRMRANTGQINAYVGDYGASTVGPEACAASSCDPAGLVARDRAVWSDLLTHSLPSATANIQCNGTVLGTPATSGAATYDGTCTFLIQWSEANLNRTSSAGAPPQQTFAWVFQP